MGTPVGYAFQWVAVKDSDGATQAGNPTTTQPNTTVHTLSTRKYVEQSARMNTNVITFTWVAPAAGFGTVRTVMVGMAVNGNNSSDGSDTCSPSTVFRLSEFVSTDRIDAPTTSMTVMPNPVADVMNLRVSTTDNDNGSVQIVDMQGRIVLTQLATILTGDNNLSVDVAHLSKGIYSVRLLNDKGAMMVSTTLVKQ
jgi:Secretion system C-terminal sorting domain